MSSKVIYIDVTSSYVRILNELNEYLEPRGRNESILSFINYIKDLKQDRN